MTGSFSGNTLTLTGTATVAFYEAALRSVTYQNIDAIDASPLARTIRFVVSDSVAAGNFQERRIEVTPALNEPVSITSTGVCESFETDGEGARYASSNALTANDYFDRVSASLPPSGYFSSQIAGPGLDGSFAWVAEDSVTAVGGEAVLLLAPYSITGFTDLNVAIALENPRFGDADQWDEGDGLAVDVSIDGGPFMMIANFRGDNATAGAGGELRQDLNLNGSSSDTDGGSIVPAVMTAFDFPLVATGDTIQVRVRFLGSGSEELAFDNICISGTDAIAPTLVLSNPANGSSVTALVLNPQGYLDVAIADNADLDVATVTDPGVEFALTGSAAAGVTVSGVPADQGGGIYRYTFTGSFSPGVVGVDFLVGSVADEVGNTNVASSVSFTVTNTIPVVSPLSQNINEDQAVVFAEGDFDSGFTDANAADTLQTLRVTSLPATGTLVRSGGGAIILADLPLDIPRAEIAGLTYTPLLNFAGPTDAFGWNASDGTDVATSATTYTFNLTELNDDPVAGADIVDRFPTSSVKISVATLLANDGDPGDTPPDLPLILESVNYTGGNGATLTLVGDTIFYLPNGYQGNDTFTYVLRDARGGIFNASSVTINALTDDNPAINGAGKNLAISIDGSSATIVGAGIPGRTYRVQVRDTNNPNAWVDLPGGTVTADPATGVINFTDPGPLPPMRIYRTVQP